jgi:hypothetical protein
VIDVSSAAGTFMISLTFIRNLLTTELLPSRRHQVRKKAAVHAIRRLEQDRRIDERVEHGLAREFVGLEAPPGLRYGQPQVRSLKEFAFDTDQQIFDPATTYPIERLVISHAYSESNSRT